MKVNSYCVTQLGDNSYKLEIYFNRNSEFIHMNMSLNIEELDKIIYILNIMGFLDGSETNFIYENIDKKCTRTIEYNPPEYKDFLMSNYYGFYSGTMNYCNIYVKGHTLYLADTDCGVVHFYGELNEENYNKVCELGKKLFLEEITVVEEIPKKEVNYE